MEILNIIGLVIAVGFVFIVVPVSWVYGAIRAHRVTCGGCVDCGEQLFFRYRTHHHSGGAVYQCPGCGKQERC